MEVIGYISALFVGLVMGLVGGGGSILSVPIFVYLFGFDPVTATTLSLFVVGITSFVGAAGFVKQKLIDFQTAWIFGIPSILGVLFSRRLILPNLPEYIIHRWGMVVSKDLFLLLLFSVLMLVASIKMIRKTERPSGVKQSGNNYTILVSQGLLVGIVTGLIGAGGGFLIVPALVMLIGLPMKKAVGTSLFIIGLNSVLGFLSSMEMVKNEYTFMLVFTALSVLGIFIGIAVAKKIDGRKLKPAFGWFVLLMGLFIIIKEIFFKEITV